MSATEIVVIGADNIVVESEHWALRGLADKINAEVDAAESSLRSAMQHAFAAGKLLTEAKAAVPQGQWELWLRRHCKVALRTAQAYMRLHKKIPELPAPEAQRVAHLPLREAIKAISTSPTAPPRYQSTKHRPSPDCCARAADALGKAADAQRKLARNVKANYVKRAQVNSVRAKLQAALAALDELQAEGGAA